MTDVTSNSNSDDANLNAPVDAMQNNTPVTTDAVANNSSSTNSSVSNEVPSVTDTNNDVPGIISDSLQVVEDPISVGIDVSESPKNEDPSSAMLDVANVPSTIEPVTTTSSTVTPMDPMPVSTDVSSDNSSEVASPEVPMPMDVSPMPSTEAVAARSSISSASKTISLNADESNVAGDSNSLSHVGASSVKDLSATDATVLPASDAVTPLQDADSTTANTVVNGTPTATAPRPLDVAQESIQEQTKVANVVSAVEAPSANVPASANVSEVTTPSENIEATETLITGDTLTQESHGSKKWLWIVLALLGLLLIVGVVLYLVQINASPRLVPDSEPTSNAPSQLTPPTVVDGFAGWETYSFARDGISFRYSALWDVEAAVLPETPSTVNLTNADIVVSIDSGVATVPSYTDESIVSSEDIKGKDYVAKLTVLKDSTVVAPSVPVTPPVPAEELTPTELTSYSAVIQNPHVVGSYITVTMTSPTKIDAPVIADFKKLLSSFEFSLF
ncbi:MAG: hypothetical protein R3B92_01810 [Patescibacteria group bacterium]